jgi:hypothetical protein
VLEWRHVDALLCFLNRLLLCCCLQVLVNPASSFTNTPWPALGPLLTQVCLPAAPSASSRAAASKPAA